MSVGCGAPPKAGTNVTFPEMSGIALKIGNYLIKAVKNGFFLTTIWGCYKIVLYHF